MENKIEQRGGIYLCTRLNDPILIDLPVTKRYVTIDRGTHSSPSTNSNDHYEREFQTILFDSSSALVQVKLFCQSSTSF